jgi:hypothetical protein
MTATQYAASINAKYPNNLFRLVEDEAHWAAMGVHTGEELRRLLAISEYEDSYKETRGFRPRRSWDGVPTEEIEAAAFNL